MLCAFTARKLDLLFGNRARYGEPVGDTSTDVIVVGAGLAGLVAACELVDRGKRVVIVEQENAANLGGQA